jgi:5'-3' exoribonuclease 1
LCSDAVLLLLNGCVGLFNKLWPNTSPLHNLSAHARACAGVPKFYRWLSERYPLINQAIDESTLLPECDNLYLDLNGSIHNATHGDGGVSKRLSDHDVMLALVNGIDEMLKLVKPRKLVYMAVDGVAPRAKMNQQRSRRFRAGRDMAEAKELARARGEDVSEENTFDSNCVSAQVAFSPSSFA